MSAPSNPHGPSGTGSQPQVVVDLGDISRLLSRADDTPGGASASMQSDSQTSMTAEQFHKYFDFLTSSQEELRADKRKLEAQLADHQAQVKDKDRIIEELRKENAELRARHEQKDTLASLHREPRDLVWDRGFYHGTVQNEKPHGFGLLSTADRKVKRYEGDWQDGKYDGYGIVFDEHSGETTYEGDFKDGKKHGKGKEYASFETRNQQRQMETKMCLVYEGDFADGKRQGQMGTEYKALDGRMVKVYEGEWRDNKRHGQGRELPHYDSSTRQHILEYTGSWVNGKRHGEGEELSRGKVTYKGGWAGGEKKGNGTAGGMELRDDRGQRLGYYHGPTLDGRPHGRGTELQQNDGQLLYEGEWANGEKTYRGKGKVGFMELKDDKGRWQGHYYHGETQDGQPNGEGEVRYRSLVVYKGGFKDGKRHGKGEELTGGKVTYEGGWEDGEKKGDGVATGMPWEQNFYHLTGSQMERGNCETAATESSTRASGRTAITKAASHMGEWREGLSHSGTLFPDGIYDGRKNADGTPKYPIKPIRWQAGQKIPYSCSCGGLFPADDL
ncbi:unnamed protein product [Vitrella brassicaformis CCMP3155]|uniref:Uncharacterized protein n=1 Tax=Vitrella brassicaformis (strain CCMP3155) TaxID=1169540 RepID=A0A0G4FPJ1_VITBC|nr:unnamed protein product [Vitrella brassicaformis CCMP3155]|eukprot:CEM15753.1 unnamed protein product [Vitrella brassicaformis CCMP3155]